MRILWITPKWTLPVTDGARVATDSLIRNVIKSGAQVDYWALTHQEDRPEPEVMKSLWGIQEASFVPRNLPASNLSKKCYYLKKLIISPLTPLTFSSFSDQRFVNELKNKLQKSHYDYIVLDGLHLGVLIDNLPGEIRSKVIYRAHNIEADLWKKSYQGAKNPLIKSFFYLQWKLVENFEKKLTQNVRGIAAISQEDFDVIKDLNTSLTLAPLGLKFGEVAPPPMGEKTEFVFIGRLDWPPNRDGLKWLLEEVWPEVIKKRSDVHLTIYGSGDRSWLNQFHSLPQLTIKGFVPSIKDAYQSAHFTLVPIFYGSGTRIKVVESFSYARRLVSTRMGVQGANLTSDDYINVESREEWIETLSQLRYTRDDFEKLLVSRERIANEFDEEKIGERLYQWMKSL